MARAHRAAGGIAGRNGHARPRVRCCRARLRRKSAHAPPRAGIHRTAPRAASSRRRATASPSAPGRRRPSCRRRRRRRCRRRAGRPACPPRRRAARPRPARPPGSSAPPRRPSRSGRTPPWLQPAGARRGGGASARRRRQRKARAGGAGIGRDAAAPTRSAQPRRCAAGAPKRRHARGHAAAAPHARARGTARRAGVPAAACRAFREAACDMPQLAARARRRGFARAPVLRRPRAPALRPAATPAPAARRAVCTPGRLPRHGSRLAAARPLPLPGPWNGPHAAWAGASAWEARFDAGEATRASRVLAVAELLT
jgi:hypothetical protein